MRYRMRVPMIMLLVAVTATASACGRQASSVSMAKCPPEPKPIVTAAEMASVLNTYDAANNKDNANLDMADQDAHEGGAEALLDDAAYATARAQGQSSVYVPFVHTNVRYYVPYRTSYPVTVLVVSTPQQVTAAPSTSTDHPEMAFQVFSRPSGSQPWRDVASGTFQSGVSPPALALDCNGFAQTVDQLDPALLSSPAGLPGRLATYLDAYAQKARPTGFGGGFGTSSLLADARSEADYAGKQGARFGQSVAPSVFPGAAWRTKDGGALVVFADSLDMRIAPASADGSVEQPDDRSRWPSVVDPGTYPTVSLHREVIMAAEDPMQGTLPYVVPLGANLDFVSASIDPCRLVSVRDSSRLVGSAPTAVAARDWSADRCTFSSNEGTLVVTSAPATAGTTPTGDQVGGLGAPAGYAGSTGSATLELISGGNQIDLVYTPSGKKPARADLLTVGRAVAAAANGL